MPRRHPLGPTWRHRMRELIRILNESRRTPSNEQLHEASTQQEILVAAVSLLKDRQDKLAALESKLKGLQQKQRNSPAPSSPQSEASSDTIASSDSASSNSSLVSTHSYPVQVYRDFFLATENPICVLNPNLVFVDVNDAFLGDFVQNQMQRHFTRSEFLAQNLSFLQLLSSDMLANILKMVAETFAIGHKSFSKEKEINGKLTLIECEMWTTYDDTPAPTNTGLCGFSSVRRPRYLTILRRSATVLSDSVPSKQRAIPPPVEIASPNTPLPSSTQSTMGLPFMQLPSPAFTGGLFNSPVAAEQPWWQRGI